MTLHHWVFGSTQQKITDQHKDLTGYGSLKEQKKTLDRQHTRQRYEVRRSKKQGKRVDANTSDKSKRNNEKLCHVLQFR